MGVSHEGHALLGELYLDKSWMERAAGQYRIVLDNSLRTVLPEQAQAFFAAAQDSSSDDVQPLRFVITAEPSSYDVDEIPTTQYPTSKEAVLDAGP